MVRGVDVRGHVDRYRLVQGGGGGGPVDVFLDPLDEVRERLVRAERGVDVAGQAHVLAENDLGGGGLQLDVEGVVAAKQDPGEGGVP